MEKFSWLDRALSQRTWLFRLCWRIMKGKRIYKTAFIALQRNLGLERLAKSITLPSLVAMIGSILVLGIVRADAPTFQSKMRSESVQAKATDTTVVYRSPGVALAPGQSKDGTPGNVITFTHMITNTGPITDIFTLKSASQQGWTVELLDSAYQTSTLQLPLRLEELGTASFVVGVTVPRDSPDGTREHITVTATSLISDIVACTVTNTLTVRAASAYTIFLPLVQMDGPPPVKLGADFVLIVTDTEVIEYDFPLVKDMGANWIRVFLSWLDIEESPGECNWDEYDPVFDRLRELEFRTMVVVYGAPDWAAEENCGPISDTLALENFIELVVSRYADVTDAWEFINEPDGIAPRLDLGPHIGCWGSYPAEYAQQLHIFSDRVKALDPGALVFFGGLAYDKWMQFEKGFFEAALQNGAGSFFDGVSLHYFPINPVEFPTMAHKINEIRETMSRNRIYNKPIWITETAMRFNTKGGVEAQRNFIVQELSRGFGAGADNMFWVDVKQESEDPPWYFWLINLDHEPDNGYNTFQHLAHKLEGLHCVGGYEAVPTGIEAYEFTGPWRSLYVLWSNTVTETVYIPSTVDAVLTSRDGDQSVVLPAQTGRVAFEVGMQPVFVEITTPEGDARDRILERKKLVTNAIGERLAR